MHQNSLHRAVKESFGTISTIYFVTKDTLVATKVNKKQIKQNDFQNSLHRAVKGSFGTISTIYFVTKDTFVATIVNKNTPT